jgi:hypothetical protein
MKRGVWGEPVVDRLPPDATNKEIINKINELVEAQNEVAAKAFGIAEVNELWSGQ